MKISFYSDTDFETGEGGASSANVARSYLKRCYPSDFEEVEHGSSTPYEVALVLESHSHWGIPMDGGAGYVIFIRYKDALVSGGKVLSRRTKALSVRLFKNDQSRFTAQGVSEPLEIATVDDFESAIQIASNWIVELFGNAKDNDTVFGKLSSAQVSSIARAFVNYRNNLERLPGAGPPIGAGEDAQRDSLLAALNMRFEDATAESFSKSGKTDIRVLLENKAVFYSECKIWSGPKSLHDAFDQLVNRYLTNRDRFGALVFFAKHKEVQYSIEERVLTLLKEGYSAVQLESETELPVVRIPPDGNRTEKELIVMIIETDSARNPR